MGMYRSRAAFVADLNQIKENSLTYNGPRSKITDTAERMILVGTKALDEVGVALCYHGDDKMTSCRKLI